MLDVADAAPADTTPLPAQPKPPAAQAAVVPAALREQEPASRTPAISALAKAETPAPEPSNGTVVLDVEQGGIEVPSFIGKSRSRRNRDGAGQRPRTESCGQRHRAGADSGSGKSRHGRLKSAGEIRPLIQAAVSFFRNQFLRKLLTA